MKTRFRFITRRKRATQSVISLFLLIVMILISVFFQVKQNEYRNTESDVAGESVVSYVWHQYLYPDPTQTPGVILPEVTAADVCEKGYTKKVRDVNVKTKKMVYLRQGLSYPQAPYAYQVDHFIPLELGGANDIANLWAQPADPKPGYLAKTIAGNYLHAQVCSGKMTLQESQELIAKKWVEVYLAVADKTYYTTHSHEPE